MSKTVILIKASANNKQSIDKYYIDPLVQIGTSREDIVVMPLLYDNNKANAKTAKAYLDILIKDIPSDTTNLIIADGAYYKYITKLKKVKDGYGRVVKAKYKGYDQFNCVNVPNYKSLFKTPENAELIKIGLNTISNVKTNFEILYQEYALSFGSDEAIYDKLYQYQELSVDIETNGLALDCVLLTIAFSWNEHEGVAIDLDTNGTYHLKKFLETYRGKLIFHNALFDVKILIRNIFMENETDFRGMNEGLRCFRNVQDTMLLAYVEKNSTTDIALDLKSLAMEYTGSYAIDAHDFTKYTRKEVLHYNLIDTLGTMYLWKKYKKHITSEIYVSILQPSIAILLKAMIVGLPMDRDKVDAAHLAYQVKLKSLHEMLKLNKYVKEFTKVLRTEALIKKNASLKRTQKTMQDFVDLEFNCGSPPQLAKLLFEFLKLPILDLTKTGAPATGKDTIKDLHNHTTDIDILEILNIIKQIAKISKIDGTFIAALRREKYFLHGNQKLGKTQSGRLASDSPNLANMPSKKDEGELIKSCFVAPDDLDGSDWLWADADFASLEERVGAILSKDPERIKVYSEGYDGHCMRTVKYFPELMPDIIKQLDDAETNNHFWLDNNGDYCCGNTPLNCIKILTKKEYLVGVTNSVKQKYPELRTNSKGPTFALQYLGTAYTLHKRAGFPLEQAKRIVKGYNDLYPETLRFNKNNEKFMAEHGYVNCAFGLQLKTPIVKKCVLGGTYTPREAMAEIRSANNAITQSWGMLLNRAIIATDNRIIEAGFENDIYLINLIHDAGYFIVRNKPEVIKFLNDTLIKEMQWNNDPRIFNKDVPMDADLDIGKSWDKQITLKHNISCEEIIDALKELDTL